MVIPRACSSGALSMSSYFLKSARLSFERTGTGREVIRISAQNTYRTSENVPRNAWIKRVKLSPVIAISANFFKLHQYSYRGLEKLAS